MHFGTNVHGQSRARKTKAVGSGYTAPSEHDINRAEVHEERQDAWNFGLSGDGTPGAKTARAGSVQGFPMADSLGECGRCVSSTSLL